MLTRTDRRSSAAAGLRSIVTMEIISGLGDGAFWVAIAAVLVDQHAGANGFALAAVARLAPRALLSAPAGIIADRLDRRRLLVTLDLLRGVTMVLLAWAVTAHVGLVGILGLVTVSYVLAAPYRPALTAGLPLVVGEGLLATANARIGTVRQLMTFLGPLFGAALVAVLPAGAGFAVNGVSFAVSAGLLSLVTSLSSHGTGARHAAEPGSFARELTAGWREVTATPGLGVVVVLVFAMYVVRGAELVLYVLVAEQNLGLGAAGIGLLSGAIGLGAVIALPAASRTTNGRAEAYLLASVVSSSIPLIALALISSTSLALLDLAILGAGVVVFEAISVVSLQRLTRRAWLGRVFGLVNTASNFGKLLGALAAPLLVATLGLSGSLVAVGSTVGLLALVAIPWLRVLAHATRTRGEQLRPIVDVLATLGIFRDAPRPALELLAGSIHETTIEAGTDVIRLGDPADDMYVVRSGAFSVTDHGREINTMTTGDWFGEIGLLQRSPRTATVTATAPSTVWVIPGELFVESISTAGAAPDALINTMADRLSRTERNHPVQV